MSLTDPDITGPRHPTLPPRALRRPTAEFARAALFGGFAVAGLALALPDVVPGTIAAAVAVFALGASVAGRFLQRDYPHHSLGLCNYMTLARLILACALIAPTLAGSGPSWAFFAVASLALSLDGVDGWLARRQGHVSAFGARFDMEVDSVLALVLAVNLALGPGAGPAAVLLGLPRYVFGIASLALPWMRRPLPERFSRKVVCVLQLSALIALQAPIVPPVLAELLIPVVAVALIWSFAVDVAWLWRRRT